MVYRRNHLAKEAAFLNPVMEFLAEKGEYLFYLGIIVHWFMRAAQNRRMVMQALKAACLALGINALLGVLLYRDRPFVHHEKWGRLDRLVEFCIDRYEKIENRLWKPNRKEVHQHNK